MWDAGHLKLFNCLSDKMSIRLRVVAKHNRTDLLISESSDGLFHCWRIQIAFMAVPPKTSWHWQRASPQHVE